MSFRAAVLTAVLALSAAAAAAGQDTLAPPPGPPTPTPADTVSVAPGPQYRAGPTHRALLGAGWRGVWTTPVDAPVFDFDTFAGGVDWTERGGGNMSITLHLEARGGWREYNFRSVDKFPEQAMPREVRGAAAGGVIRDLVSALFPAAPLMVPPLVAAIRLPHVDPVLRLMPDDPRLGVYRDTFAGMLGTVEPKANEAPGDEPGFAASRKIKGTEAFLEDLEESPAHRLDERAFLAARLVDFLINDTDRTLDNMRWARYDAADGYRWVPLPIDRDWAFHDAGGLATSLIRKVYPKLVPYGPEFPPVAALTYSTHLLDRQLLQRLDCRDFEATATDVRAQITDEVIEAVIAEMPEEWRRETDAPARIREALRGRRDELPGIARAFYDLLAADVDVRGTDEAERATIERLPDGGVRVTIEAPSEGAPAFYDRTFLPAETGEVRVYLHGGDDVAHVTGAATAAITVRIIGGGGDDALIDGTPGRATRFYDARGDNRFEPGPHTAISTRRWEPPELTEGLRMGSGWFPDWGGGMSWGPAAGYGDVAGVIVGGGPSWKAYGFRRLPHHWRAGARLLYATRARSFGADLTADYRYENSPLALTLDARAVSFDAFRFHGLGNRSDDLGDDALFERDLVAVHPALAWHIGWRDRETGATLVGPGDDPAAASRAPRPLVGRLDLGPLFLWSELEPAAGSPLADVRDAGGVARAGLRTRLALDRTDRHAAPRRGWRLEASASAFPALLGLEAAFAAATGQASAYLPLLGSGPHLAVRAGGSAVTDGAPVEHSAWIGGRTTLRGYEWQRFRGEAAAHGSAELRIPVTRVDLFLRWDLGIFGLADAGRVWVDGESPGGWHTAFGGGVWLDALGHALSAAYARGEEGRLYLQLGLFY